MSTNQDDPCRMEEDRSTSTVEEEPDGASTTINTVERYNNTVGSTRQTVELDDRSGGGGGNIEDFSSEQRTANSTTRVRTEVDTVKLNLLNYPIVVEKTIDVTFDNLDGFNRVQEEVTSATNPINVEKEVTVLEASNTVSTKLIIEFLEPEGTQETPLQLFVRLFYKFGNLTSGKSSIFITSDDESDFGVGPEKFGGEGAFGVLQSTRPGKKFF